jgi:hypothetical protein
VYTPDGQHLVVQRRSRRVALSDVTATEVRTRWLFTVLTLHLATGSDFRIRDWVWSERFIDPMDDRFLDMVARLVTTPDVALERWNPLGAPTASEMAQRRWFVTKSILSPLLVTVMLLVVFVANLVNGDWGALGWLVGYLAVVGSMLVVEVQRRRPRSKGHVPW